MYEILEKCSTKKTKASHPQPKKISQAIILKKPERPVVQMAGGAVELQKTDFEVIDDEALSRGSTRPRRIRFLKNITDEQGTILFAVRTEWVMKSGISPEQVKTEVLTNKLYEAALVPVKPVYLVKIEGRFMQLMRYIEGYESPKQSELQSSEDFIRYVGADMIFANWDLFKTDNWLKESGRMIRIDNGGALDIRAQGGIRELWKEGLPPELETMRNGPYSGLERRTIAESIRRLYDVLTPTRIDGALEESGYGAEDLTGQKRERMKTVLLDRLWNAMIWANEQFPFDLREEIPVPELRSVLEDESADDGIGLGQDTMELLRGFGFTIPVCVNTPLLFRIYYQWLTLPERLFLQSISDQEEWEAFMSIADELEEFPNYQKFLPEILKKIDPHTRLPLVGPEEIYEPDGNGGSMPNPFARQMPEILYRMRGGRLIRRMSAGEKNAFEQALGERDITRVVELLFPSVEPGKRGEIVWSVNRPYVFDRETRETREPPETPATIDTSPPYAWILEIYISESMIRFISNYAFFENAVPKSSAFLGNPALKREGGSGGSSDSSGIPNFLVKKEGFEHFWRTVERYHFEEAATYIRDFLKGGVPRESEDDRIARLREQGRRKREERRQKQKQREEEWEQERERERTGKPTISSGFDEDMVFPLDSSMEKIMEDTLLAKKEAAARTLDPPERSAVRVQVREPIEEIYTVQQVLAITSKDQEYNRFHNFWDKYDYFRSVHAQACFYLSPLQVINYRERENPMRLYILNDDDWAAYEEFKRTNKEFVYMMPGKED